MTSPGFLTKTLYIPIEIFDRELGGALLLSAEAVSRGWRVVMGGKQGIFNNMSRFRRMPGIFYLKSIVPGEVFKQKEIMADGHRITALDVEGLVPTTGETGVKLRYSEESIALTDLLFFWGQNDYESVRAVYPGIAQKSVVSGSPIIDEILVRRKRAASEKRASPKRRILVGTSCGFANHLNGIEFSRQMIHDAIAKNKDNSAAEELEHQIVLDERIFEYWKEAVPRIGESFRDCEVVLRPHPSENKQFWKNHLKGYGNIRIDEGGSILEEMLHADVYVHFNSTSALTSMILGIPTLMPFPTFHDDLVERVTFVKDLSITAQTTEELLDQIRRHVANPDRSVSTGPLARYCANLGRDGYSASKVILDALEKRYTFSSEPGVLLDQAPRERLIVFLKKLKFFLMWTAGIALSLVGVKPGRPFPPRNAYRNANAKQPDTPAAEVRHMLSQLLDADAADRIDLERKARNLFVMGGRVR
jgi:surface carbohydrate biosynthesis protein